MSAHALDAPADRRRAVVWTAAGGAAAAATVAFAVATVLADGTAAVWAANGGWTLSALFAVIGLAHACRRVSGFSRRAWGYLLAAAALWLAGQLCWNFYTLFDGDVPTPSVADALWLAFTFPAAFGVYSLAPASRGLRRVLKLGSLSIGLAVGALAAFFYGDALAASELAAAAKATIIAYPILYVAAAVIMLDALLASGRLALRLDFGLVLGGLALEAAAFTAWTGARLDGTYVSGGGAIDLVWMAGLLLIGLGGFVAREGAPTATTGRAALRIRGATAGAALTASVAALGVAVATRQAVAEQLALLAIVGAAGASMLLRQWLLSRELVRVERALQDEVDSYFRLARDMICVASPDGRFLRLNGAWESALGWTKEELTARPFIEFVHPDDIQATLDETTRLSRGEHTVDFANRYRTKDGSYRWLLWSAVAAADGQIYAAARDDTARHETRQELERVNRELEAFAYTTSHDLRAPLVSIEGFAAALERRAAERLDERELDFLARIRSNASSLQRLIEDLLDFARASRAETQTVDADALAREVVDELAQRAQERGARVEVVTAIPPLRSHPARFKQALTNLVENALAYARPDGPLAVRIDARRANGHVEVVVEDDGLGIPAPEREKVFDLFVRGRSGREESPEGTGVGLALVKAIAESSGGSARYEDAPGGGSRFVLAFERGEHE